MPIPSRNVDQKSKETVFSILICHLTGDKWQLKTLFLSFFDPYSSIVDNVFDCRLSGVVLHKMNIRAVKHSQLSITQILESQSICTLLKPK